MLTPCWITVLLRAKQGTELLLVVWPLQPSPAGRIPGLLAQATPESGASPRPGLARLSPSPCFPQPFSMCRMFFLSPPLGVTSSENIEKHSPLNTCGSPCVLSLLHTCLQTVWAATTMLVWRGGQRGETLPHLVVPVPPQPPLAPLAVTHGRGHQLSVAKSPPALHALLHHLSPPPLDHHGNEETGAAPAPTLMPPDRALDTIAL